MSEVKYIERNQYKLSSTDPSSESECDQSTLMVRDRQSETLSVIFALQVETVRIICNITFIFNCPVNFHVWPRVRQSAIDHCTNAASLQMRVNF